MSLKVIPMSQKEIIQKFYASFSQGEVEEMINCYHDEVIFEDPAFGRLQGNRAKAMWEMLLSRREKSNLSIEFSLDEGNENRAKWTATYYYGPKRRKVVNHISAHFEFKEGKIIQHTDVFPLWKWTQQALGLAGYALGWSSFMKRKIRQTTNKALDQFIEKQHS